MDEKMMKRLNEQLGESGGWEICDADDVLDPMWDSTQLNESLSEEELKSIKPCDIVFCMATNNDDWRFYKKRPLLVAFSGSLNTTPILYGFPVTTVPSDPAKPHTKFRYALKDWAEVGLAKQSYINYDHFVRNLDDDINFGNKGHFGITKRDAKGLAYALEMSYQDLVALSYKTPEQQKLLDDFINTLEAL